MRRLLNRQTWGVRPGGCAANRTCRQLQMPKTCMVGCQLLRVLAVHRAGRAAYLRHRCGQSDAAKLQGAGWLHVRWPAGDHPLVISLRSPPSRGSRAAPAGPLPALDVLPPRDAAWVSWHHTCLSAENGPCVYDTHSLSTSPAREPNNLLRSQQLAAACILLLSFAFYSSSLPCCISGRAPLPGWRLLLKLGRWNRHRVLHLRAHWRRAQRRGTTHPSPHCCAA